MDPETAGGPAKKVPKTFPRQKEALRYIYFFEKSWKRLKTKAGKGPLSMWGPVIFSTTVIIADSGRRAWEV